MMQFSGVTLLCHNAFDRPAETVVRLSGNSVAHCVSGAYIGRRAHCAWVFTPWQNVAITADHHPERSSSMRDLHAHHGAVVDRSFWTFGTVVARPRDAACTATQRPFAIGPGPATSGTVV